MGLCEKKLAVYYAKYDWLEGNKLQNPCGSDYVCVLDGRMNLENCKQAAREHWRKYKGLHPDVKYARIEVWYGLSDEHVRPLCDFFPV
jgi:DNA polymerase IIIc chi subunit